jgi:hypothetical protein
LLFGKEFEEGGLEVVYAMLEGGKELHIDLWEGPGGWRIMGLMIVVVFQSQSASRWLIDGPYAQPRQERLGASRRLRVHSTRASCFLRHMLPQAATITFASHS